MKYTRFLFVIFAVLMFFVPVARATEASKVVLETEVAVVQSTEDWRLRLVNPWNPLPKDYSVERKRLANGLSVDARIYDDLKAMLTDCRATGLEPVVCSAYRSWSKQTSLYQNKIARLQKAGYSYQAAVQEAGRWVAVPGTSEHQMGMALDLVSASYQLLDEHQADTPEQKWLMEHCWEYGFVMRYPADKTEITGIGYEPWHYRYVGREAAAVMQEQGLCLEEYLEYLQTVPEPIEQAMEIETVESSHFSYRKTEGFQYV